MSESKNVTFKQLKKYLFESISAKREIFEYADIWIEDQINIDNPNYTFEKMREYASHESEINYNEIAKGILERFPNMSDEAKELLEEFIDSSTLTDIVVDAIDEAVVQQAASLDPFA